MAGIRKIVWLVALIAAKGVAAQSRIGDYQIPGF